VTATVANVIHFDRRHQEAQLNLPWYAADELDAPERERFEAHLALCPECQADLALERRLRAACATAPLDAALGAMQPQSGAALLEGRASARRGFRQVLAQWTRRHGLKAAVALQAALVLLLVAVAIPRSGEPSYQALGAAPAAGQAGANIVVLFHPDVAERDLRAALNDSGARLVDGPLAAGAYLLRVPDEERAAALSSLRASAAVALAQPIDAEPPP
jgi:hypothetical protein